MVEIEVSIRGWWIDSGGDKRDLYHAQIKDQSGCWGSGRTTYAAIGDLVSHHVERFGVSITYPGKKEQ
jgi:hypothetical protein